MGAVTHVPAKAWVVTFAGTAVNLCLGILYAWSVWKKHLVDAHQPGSPMAGLNEGWTYLTDAQATWAYALCGFMFALFMIPGGRLQDRYGPRSRRQVTANLIVSPRSKNDPDSVRVSPSTE